jgi:hypothetical protein
MKEIIMKSDMFGYQPKLNIKGEKKHSTLFTGLISILVGILAILCTFYFGYDLVFKNSPYIIKTTDTSNSFGPHNFSNLNYNVMIGMQTKDFAYYVDPTVFYVSASMTIIRNIRNNITGHVDQHFTVEEVGIDLCSKFYKNEDMIEKNMQFPLNMYYCPEPEKAYMQGYWGSDLFVAFRIYFKKCKNTTENNNHCKTPEEISKALQGAYFAYEMTSYQFDQLNFDQPFKRIFADNYNIVNSQLSLEYAMGFESLELESDSGLVFKDSQKYYVLDYHEKIFYKLGDSESFVSFTFEGTTSKTIYIRSYAKLQTVVTQIGGFMKFILIMASFISNFISENHFYFDYFNQLLTRENMLVSDKSNFKTSNINYKKLNIERITKMNLLSSKVKAHNNIILNDKNNISVMSLFKSDKRKEKAVKKKNIFMFMFQLLMESTLCICKRKKDLIKVHLNLKKTFREYTSIDYIVRKSFGQEKLINYFQEMGINFDENFNHSFQTKIIGLS